MNAILIKPYTGKYIVTGKSLQVIDSTEKKATATRISCERNGRVVWQWSNLIGKYVLLGNHPPKKSKSLK